MNISNERSSGQVAVVSLYPDIGMCYGTQIKLSTPPSVMITSLSSLSPLTDNRQNILFTSHGSNIYRYQNKLKLANMLFTFSTAHVNQLRLMVT